MKAMIAAGVLALAVTVGVGAVAVAQGGNGGGQGGVNQGGSSPSVGVQTEERNIVSNQGETTQVTTTERNMVREQGNGMGPGNGQGPMEEAARTMMQIAERNQGEESQIRNRVQAQLETHRKIEEDADRLRSQNRFMRFLFGPDDDTVAEAEGLLAQNRVRIQELNQVMNKLQNQGDQQQLREQLRILESEQTKLESRVREEAGGLSLFGWLF